MNVMTTDFTLGIIFGWLLAAVVVGIWVVVNRMD